MLSPAKDTVADSPPDAGKSAADKDTKAQTGAPAAPATPAKTAKPAPKPVAARPAAKTSAAKTSAAKKTADNESPEEKAAKTRAAMEEAAAAASLAEAAAREASEAAKKAAAAKAVAEAAAEAEYKAIATHVKSNASKKPVYTFKRQSDEIFRRDMGEPEFFLDKRDRFPRPILTPEQQESLTRHAEQPRDQTPVYIPEHMLSPEFEGVSNYERGVTSYLEELRATYKRLKNRPDATSKEVSALKSKITYLESLHENFYIGMNVFRTAKGGRSKLKK